MKILCHVGPWCKDQFEAIAKGMDADAHIAFISGFRDCDAVGFMPAYYGYVDGSEDLSSFATMDDPEIIARCRLLRSLPATEAMRHIYAARRAVREVLDAVRPDVFLCESIDQFLHDILFREARAAGIPSYGLIRTFVNGYYRLSERGEMQIVRTPPAEEIEQIRAKLTEERYIPANLIRLKRRAWLTYARIVASNIARIVYFAIKRQVSGERYNYHYWTSERTTRQLYAHVIPKWTLGVADWKQRIRAGGKPVIFIPLQHFPEATVDYWSEDVEFVDYPRRLAELIELLRRDFHVLLKEHPGVWGYRKPGFYHQFEGLEGVTICPTNERSQECIAATDAVLVWTGSVGYEAALRGKPVLTVCTPYYMAGDRFLHIDMRTPAALIADFIARCNGRPVTPVEQGNLVRHLLSGIVTGRFQNDGSYDPASTSDSSDAHAIGVTLGQVLRTSRASDNTMPVS